MHTVNHDIRTCLRVTKMIDLCIDDDTRINKKLGNYFRNYYLGNSKNRIIAESEMTLQEFFLVNNKFLYHNNHKIICDTKINDNSFSFQSKTFKRLKKYLISVGFTEKDWILLRSSSQKPQETLFDTKPYQLDKEYWLQRTLVSLCWIKIRTRNFDFITSMIPKGYLVELRDVIALDQDDVDRICGTKGNWKIPYEHVQSLRKTLEKIQIQMRIIGFDDQDGPFMSLACSPRS